MKNIIRRAVAAASAATLLLTMVSIQPQVAVNDISAAAATTAEWGLMSISGGGFVSGLVAGKKTIYCRTDVGGAYRMENGKWVQLMGFLSEKDKGMLSVEAMCVDPNDDNNIYLLCGCNYFSDARTEVFHSTDGGKSFTSADVSDYIRVHGNGVGRQQGERIAIDPNNPKIVYAGGRTGGLIKSVDGGVTWAKVDAFDKLGLFDNTIKWPQWTDHMENTTASENGICTLYVDKNSKLYVGVSTVGTANLYVSGDKGGSFKALSASLPTDKYIARINAARKTPEMPHDISGFR